MDAGADDHPVGGEDAERLRDERSGGGEDDRGVERLGRVSSLPPAQDAPSSRANACVRSSPARVNANTSRPWNTATWQIMCAAEPNP